MDIELAKGGNASTAATLVVNTFRQCEDGVVFVDFAPTPGGTVQSETVVTTHINGETTPTKDGGNSTVVRVKVKTPISQYNSNGTVVTSLPEIQAHLVIRVPRLIANALSGTVTTSRDDTTDTYPAKTAAMEACCRALAYLCSIATNQPINWERMYNSFNTNVFFTGAIGVCPLDYQNGDYGTIRVQPPPARS